MLTRKSNGRMIVEFFDIGFHQKLGWRPARPPDGRRYVAGETAAGLLKDEPE
jgi:hypothetical protein